VPGTVIARPISTGGTAPGCTAPVTFPFGRGSAGKVSVAVPVMLPLVDDCVSTRRSVPTDAPASDVKGPCHVPVAKGGWLGVFGFVPPPPPQPARSIRPAMIKAFRIRWLRTIDAA
jgi:hypothetical protein